MLKRREEGSPRDKGGPGRGSPRQNGVDVASRAVLGDEVVVAARIAQPMRGEEYDDRIRSLRGTQEFPNARQCSASGMFRAAVAER